MIAPNSIASRKTTEPVRTTMRRTARAYVCRRGALGGAPVGCCDRDGGARPISELCVDATRQLRRRSRRLQGCARRRRGSSGGIPLLRNPARGPKKMHRVGLASVQFTRSTSAEATAGRESLQPSALRARCTRKPTGAFGRSQAPIRDNVSQIATITFAAGFAREFRSTQKRTEGGGSVVRPPN